MKDKIQKQMDTIKFVGGALIVAAAGLIMLPGFISVFQGLGKILLMIVIAGGACLSLAYVTLFIRRARQNGSATPTVAPTSPEHNP